jgi:hypothetical protein
MPWHWGGSGGFRDQISVHGASRSSGWPSGLHDPDGTDTLDSLFRDDRSGGVPAARHLCNRLFRLCRGIRCESARGDRIAGAHNLVAACRHRSGLPRRGIKCNGGSAPVRSGDGVRHDAVCDFNRRLGAYVQEHDIGRRGEHLEHDQIPGSAAPGACLCDRARTLITSGIFCQIDSITATPGRQNRGWRSRSQRVVRGLRL